MASRYLKRRPYAQSWSAFERGQTSISSDTPLSLPEAVIAFGMVLLALQFLARFTQALLGLPGDKVIGRTDDELFLDKTFAAFIKETDDDVLRTGETRRYEEELAARRRGQGGSGAKRRRAGC